MECYTYSRNRTIRQIAFLLHTAQTELSSMVAMTVPDQEAEVANFIKAVRCLMSFSTKYLGEHTFPSCSISIRKTGSVWMWKLTVNL